MQPVYPDELLPVARDTSGDPVDPMPDQHFQMLGPVYATSTDNAYTAEQAAQQYNGMSPLERQRILRAQQEYEQAAIRYAGQRKFRSLVEGGAKPEEALRVAAPELFFNDPKALTSALRFTKPTPTFEPQMMPTSGGRIFMAGPNRAQFIADKAPIMPPDAKANLDILKNRLKTKTTGPLAIAADPKEVSALENEIVNASTNWMGRASPQPEAEKKSPFKEGQTVRNKKDGKLYKIVKGVPVLQE